MRTAFHAEFGEPSEVLALGDSPLPQPASDEVRIKTLLTPVHNHDALTVLGLYSYKPSLPAIGGTEAVGVVDELGPGVTGITVGQRVAVAGVHGTWAEYFIAPAATLVPLPDIIDDETAAQLIAMPLSALMLLEFLNVHSGDWIIQNTANGAVGKSLAMLAKARGVNVVNLVRRDAGRDELATLGIGNVVSTVQPDWTEQVRSLTGGAPLRAAVDSIGGKASGDLLSLLGDGGLFVSFGAMGSEPMQLSAGDLIFKQVTARGFWGTRVAEQYSLQDLTRLIGEVLTLAAKGELKLQTEAIYDLSEAGKAVGASLQGGRKGKILLRP